MKRNFLIYLVVFLGTIIAFSSCTGLKRMKKKQSVISYSLNPQILEMHGDSVAISISGKLLAK